MNAEIRSGRREHCARGPERADRRPRSGAVEVERREILRDYGRTRTLITVDVEVAPRRRKRERRIGSGLEGGIPPWEVDPAKPRILRLSSGPITLSPDGAELPPKPKQHSGHKRARSRTGAELWVGKPLLRKRGWTEAAIRDFLPKPERLKRNPHPRGRNRPMPLWRPRTVAKAEASPQWRDWLEASLTRRGTTLRSLSKTFPASSADAAVDAAIENHRRTGRR